MDFLSIVYTGKVTSVHLVGWAKANINWKVKRRRNIGRQCKTTLLLYSTHKQTSDMQKHKIVIEKIE